MKRIPTKTGVTCCLLFALLTGVASLTIWHGQVAVAKADAPASSYPSWAIGPFTRYGQNPILQPTGTTWESKNVWNPGVIVRNNTFEMLYRAAHDNWTTGEAGISSIGLASSSNDYTFTQQQPNPVIDHDQTYDIGGVEDPRLLELNGTYYAYYTGNRSPSANNDLDMATSTDLVHWTKYGPIFANTKDAAVVMDPQNHPVKIHHVLWTGWGDLPGLLQRLDPLAWFDSCGFPLSFELPAVGNLCRRHQLLDNAKRRAAPGHSDLRCWQVDGGSQWRYAISETEFSGSNLTQQLDQIPTAIMIPNAPYETGQTVVSQWMNSIVFYQGQWWMYYGAGNRSVALAVAPLRNPPSVPAFTNEGISRDANPTVGHFDGGSGSYSNEALTAAGFAPGATVQVNGATLQWPSLSDGSSENWQASGQVIPVSGAGTTLAFLGAATHGPASGTATVTYTDGTTQTFTLAFSDWTLNAGTATILPDNSVAAHMSYRNTATGKQSRGVYVFSSSVSLVSGKTITSVTLPNTVAGGAIHVFALSLH